MRRTAIILAALLASAPAHGQVKCNEGLEPLDTKAESRMTAVDFIRLVAANELVFSKAFTSFGYTLDVDLRTMQDDTVDGQFHQVTRISFDSAGARRVEKVGEPVNTLKRLSLANRDVEAVRDAFTITPDVLADRDIVFSGRQKLTDFNAAVFDILPRNGQTAARAFSGRVWVRVRDNAIARICGRVNGGPFGPMRYLVERTKVADKFWFPTQIRADENTRAGDEDVHVRIDLKYSDYAQR